MNPPPHAPAEQCRRAIGVRGVVQGVGFRPFVYNRAIAHGLAGWVRNDADRVRIEVQGERTAVDAFVEALRDDPPPQARVDRVDVAELSLQDGHAEPFEIRASDPAAAPQPTIPADLATCADCLAEIRTPSERRFGYPFTNCTNCGPRWSIIERLPYDRLRTSMAGFEMCPDCRGEYEDPTDRRFHAQPIACPRCGPVLELLRADGKPMDTEPEALVAAAEAVVQGQILALKGLGGFQLVVDATNRKAVAELRRRKHRPDKPFALMIASIDEVRRRCQLSQEEARVIASPQAPILLLRQRRDADATADIAPEAAPGNPYLGVMLPSSPLHHLLLAEIGRPIVCTSGNLSEEPMAITTEEALEQLGNIADLFLTHDRPIIRPVDDSVARVGPDGLQVHRRARGFAPLPIELPSPGPVVLAVGGHLKNAVALSLGARAVVSSHVGDLDNARSVEVHRRAIDDLIDFFDVVPERIACDLHPDYASTRHAEVLAARWNVPLVHVQHHHAHVVAGMIEHRLPGPVLGFSWDGTGYGSDGTAWGGEALVCDGAGFHRVAHLRTFPLPGGDRAAREPRRSALGVLFEILGEDAAEYATDWFSPAEVSLLLTALARSLHSPRSSSMGRLFDAVAALCGLPGRCSFEGHAAMALEFAADGDVEEAYPLPISDDEPAVADWEPLVRAILADRRAGEPIGRISARFHNGLAEMAVAVARREGRPDVVLTGGCFQNALLTERVRGRLLLTRHNVYTHRCVPPGDGGLALGQLAVAIRSFEG